MTFAWQTHAGDRAGVRLSFAPKLADVVPISVEVVLPIADTVDLDYGNVVMAARLPLFYWKTDVSGEQPLQRGANTINAPKGATMLELGVHRNVQKQIIDNEYVYNDDSGTGQAILKKVIFKTSVPNTNTNLPRYGDRDYEIDITRITVRKPWVVTAVEQSQSVVNAEVMMKTVILRFNNGLPFPARFLIADAMNRPIGNESMGRLGSIDDIEGKLKLGILNNPAVQGALGVLESSAYSNLVVSRSSSPIDVSWTICSPSTYPLAGEFFNNSAFLINQGTRAVKLEYRYNRLVVNGQIIASGYPEGWERVYVHFAKIWRNSNNIGKNYRDSFTEILEPNYVVM